MRTAIGIALLVIAALAACTSPQPPPTQKLDDLDYHAGSAVEAGLSDGAGGAHIAYFLVWAVERGFTVADHPDDAVAQQIRDRDAAAFMSVLGWFDGVVSTDVLREEGAMFAASCYEAYTGAYDAAFGQRAYHEPNWSDYDATAGILDELRRSACA
jgi:hypothetical protein